MPNHPLMELGDREGNSPSPFANLKEDSTDNDKPIWRTGSLDEGCRRMSPNKDYSDENQDNDSTVVTALHSSFDASLLADEGQGESIFRPTSAGKHARNAEETDVDLFAPGTVRKLRRRSDLPPGPKNTPGRHSHNLRSAKGERTPTSTAGRRRAHQRRSPRHQPSSRIPPSSAKFKFQETTGASPATPGASPATPGPQLKQHPQILTPTRAAAATPHLPHQATTTVKKAHTCQTATTVNSSFDGMNDSHETSSPTPFRFTSFPASLPRVNNARGPERNYTCPPSTRKHMTFSAFGEEDVVDEHAGKGSSNMNSSNEEDVTNNSSLSSLSAENQREVAAPSAVRPKALEWKSPAEDADMSDRKYSIDSEVAEARLNLASPVHTGRLFADDELADSPGQDSKIKLDFHPGEGKGVKYVFGKEKESDIDLSRPYEQRKTNSFPSTASSTTPLRNISTFEDGTIDSGMTPSGPGGMNMAEHTLSPEQHVKFHFHVDATQCSPIPGIPEEEIDGVTKGVPAMTMMDTGGPVLDPSATSRQLKERPPRSAPRKRSQHRSGDIQSWTRKGSTPSKDSSKLSLSNESGDSTSSTTSSKQRRLRPMPDMNAFDAGVSSRASASSSRNEKSTDESSGGTVMMSRAAPPSPQLVCPPTPQRTPAWASYSDQGPQQTYSRQNSLIATKVLATCPSQVLDGHSSLENSLMEDDEDESEDHGVLFGTKPTQAFSALAEDMEEEESPVRDLTSLHELLAPGPSSAMMPRLRRQTSDPVVGSSSTLPPPPAASTSCSGRVQGDTDSILPTDSVPKTPAAPRLSSGSIGGVGSVISFSSDFDNLGKLGSGAFADVYKVRSRSDHQMYAVKRNRRQFRGKRDRDLAMAEVRIMQRLQSVCAHSGTSEKKEKAKSSYSLYLLFFLRAWQEGGHFFCQTELCCRDTCREMKVALGPQWFTSQKLFPSLKRHLPTQVSEADGHLIPENTVWKICHDVMAGLSHIHSHGVVHNDIKPSNIFFVAHDRLGALVKIGDFGIAGDIGTSEDGQEGDTKYMAPELLSVGTRQPSADIFSLGLTLYELASNLSWELPSEGPRWQELRQELRHGSHTPDLPRSRRPELGQLIQAMLKPDPTLRPSANVILNQVANVKEAGSRCDEFLRDYIKDIEAFDRVQEERLALERLEAAERCAAVLTIVLQMLFPLYRSLTYCEIYVIQGPNATDRPWNKGHVCRKPYSHSFRSGFVYTRAHCKLLEGIATQARCESHRCL